MSNPYQTPPPGPYGGPGQQPHAAPYGAPQYQQPVPQPVHPQPVHPQQGYPAGYAYQPPVYQAPVPVPVVEPNQYATAAVVLGFVAVLTTCFYGGLLGLIGLGVAIAGLNRSNTTGVGRGMSIGAIVLNVLAVLITIAVIVLVVQGKY
ncbi:hypothetical protein ACWEQL_32825 [Kitasatospora sp. NPDC004240]